MELHGVRMTDVRPVAGGLFIGYDAGAADPRRMLGEPTARLFFKRAPRGESRGLFRGYTSKWHRRNGAPCWRVTALGSKKPGGPLDHFVRNAPTREAAEALLIRHGCRLNGIKPPKIERGARAPRLAPAYRLHAEELAAVLAGLRMIQSAGDLPGPIADIFTNCGELAGLTNDEIDRLCERLNTEDDACPEDPDGVHFVGCGCVA